MDLEYAWEKLYDAVLGMAKSPAALRERIRDAYVGGIMLLEADDLPPELRPRLEELHHRLTSGTPKGAEGTIAAAVEALDDEEVVDVAASIVALFDEVAAFRHDG